ncbi:hypothetical protein KBC86_02350 [Candidatus Gracilibacteria bacterium]|nr:hypothetical protein [Candidatus Gracilibacteria bacterium]
MLKNQKDSGLKFLSLLKRYGLTINNLRNGKFQLYDTEEIIYQERWNQLIKIWIELQNEHTLTELLFPSKKEELILTNLVDLQIELKANLDSYLDRKRRGKWKGDTSDSQISKIIFSTNSSDEFGVKIQNEINTLSEPIKNELSKQFNIKF